MRTVALGTALACLWGSGFFWIRLSLDGLTPFQLTFARLALGAVVLLGVILATRRTLRVQPRALLGHLVVAALLANAIPYTLFAIAEQTVPSSTAGAINATTPLWTALIVLAVGGDTRPEPTRIAGLVLGFAGAVVVLEPWSAAQLGAVGGLVACAAAALSYGISYVYQSWFLANRGVPPLVLAALQLSAAAVILAATLPVDAGHTPVLSPLVLVAIGVLGVLGTGIAYVINFELIARGGAISASTVTYVVPVVAVALGVAVLREPLTWTLPAGLLLVLAGTALTTRRQPPASVRHERAA